MSGIEVNITSEGLSKKDTKGKKKKVNINVSTIGLTKQENKNAIRLIDKCITSKDGKARAEARKAKSSKVTTGKATKGKTAKAATLKAVKSTVKAGKATPAAKATAAKAEEKRPRKLTAAEQKARKPRVRTAAQQKREDARKAQAKKDAAPDKFTKTDPSREANIKKIAKKGQLVFVILVEKKAPKKYIVKVLQYENGASTVIIEEEETKRPTNAELKDDYVVYINGIVDDKNDDEGFDVDEDEDAYEIADLWIRRIDLTKKKK
jgi:hypothetical protein